MAIRYRVNARLATAQLKEIYDSSGLRRPVGDPPRLRRMRDGAALTITALDGRRIVGIARALSDFACRA